MNTFLKSIKLIHHYVYSVIKIDHLSIYHLSPPPPSKLKILNISWGKGDLRKKLNSVCVCICPFVGVYTYLSMCVFIYGMWLCFYLYLKWSEYEMCINSNLNLCKDMNLFMKVWIKKYSQWDKCWFAEQIAKNKKKQKQKNKTKQKQKMNIQTKPW